MTSPLDAPLRAVAQNLMRTFAKEGTITYEATGDYDTTLGLASTGSDGEETVKGTVEEYREGEIDGQLVRRGDIKWTIAAGGVTKPRVNDSVALDGQDWTVQRVKPIYSGDLAALYELQLRR